MTWEIYHVTELSIFSLWLSTEVVAFSPRPHPYLPCFAPLSRERLSALLSKLKYYGLTGLLMQLTLLILGFRGTWLPWRNVRSRLYDGRVGEVANRVSCGSFRGGHWYLPIRNHDNRYFADWIRLCPGLSKNSENGNSCPKPHKVARMIEAVGRAVSIETETIIAIWILQRRSSQLYKGKLIKMETKMVKMDREKPAKIGMFTRPKDKTILSFSGSPTVAFVAGIYPGSAMQWDALAFLPHPTDITDM